MNISNLNSLLNSGKKLYCFASVSPEGGSWEIQIRDGGLFTKYLTNFFCFIKKFKSEQEAEDYFFSKTGRNFIYMS